MSSKKANEQAMTWLRSIAADKNSMDGINAELVINIIEDLRRQLNSKGVVIGNLMRERPSVFTVTKDPDSEWGGQVTR